MTRKKRQPTDHKQILNYKQNAPKTHSSFSETWLARWSVPKIISNILL